MFFSIDRQAKRMGIAAILSLSMAVAANATSLISLEISANDYAPTGGAVGLFTDDPGNADDVDLDFTASTITPMVFNTVGDSFTFSYGQLSLAGGNYVVPGLDVPGSNVVDLSGSISSTFESTVNAERFDGQALEDVSLGGGDLVVSTGEAVDMGPGGFFYIFGQSRFGPQSATVNYTFANGVQAEIQFDFTDPEMNNTSALIGDGVSPLPGQSEIQMTATLTDYMIPEPSTYALFGLSLGLMALLRRRRKS